MDKDVELSAAPEGFFVRDKQGKFYFMRTEEGRRYQVTAEDEPVVEKIWKLESSKTSPPSGIHPDYSCESLVNWMMNHNIDENWRKVSVIWMNQC